MAQKDAQAQKDPRLLDVLVATYDNIDDALDNLEDLRVLYDSLGTSYNFDAAVVSKNQRGRVKINKSYEAGKRHEALRGLGFGLAAGLVAAIFPAVGIGAALVAGGVGGAAIGAIVGHVQSGIPRDDLKKIADQLDKSTAALIVVYETSLTDQIAKNIKAVRQTVTKLADLRTDAIADEIKEARSA
jgi:uncharacterized membrane protein